MVHSNTGLVFRFWNGLPFEYRMTKTSGFRIPTVFTKRKRMLILFPYKTSTLKSALTVWDLNIGLIWYSNDQK